MESKRKKVSPTLIHSIMPSPSPTVVLNRSGQGSVSSLVGSSSTTVAAAATPGGDQFTSGGMTGSSATSGVGTTQTAGSNPGGSLPASPTILPNTTTTSPSATPVPSSTTSNSSPTPYPPTFETASPDDFWSVWPQFMQNLPSPPNATLDFSFSPPSSPNSQNFQPIPPSSPLATALIPLPPMSSNQQHQSQQLQTLHPHSPGSMQFPLGLNIPGGLNPSSLPLSPLAPLSSPFQSTPFPSSSPPLPTGDAGEGATGKGGKSRKKTSRACVYCQRSHSCCDSFRPCSKCVQRGIGHLCRDGEPKTTKRREYMYLLADNPGAAASSSKRQKIQNVPTSTTQSSGAQKAKTNNNNNNSSTSLVPTSVNNFNFAQIFGHRKIRPFPRDIRISFHRLAERCGRWSEQLIAMWSKVEEFWSFRDKLEPPHLRNNVTPFRHQVKNRATAVMNLLNDLSEPMLIWSEGLRIYAVNKAAQAFFGRSAEEMTNAKLGYEDDNEDETAEWHPEQDLDFDDHAFRLFDLIHPEDATAFGCSAAADAMSLIESNGTENRCRGFRMKVRVNLTKQQADRADVVPTVILNNHNSNASSSSTHSENSNEASDQSVTCVVTQSHFRDFKGRFLFASCTFVRIDDL